MVFRVEFVFSLKIPYLLYRAFLLPLDISHNRNVARFQGFFFVALITTVSLVEEPPTPREDCD